WSKSPSSESSHRIGLLRPTPRGSKLTRSNRSRSVAGTVDAIPVRKDTPGAPGPPGLNTSEPMRCRGSRARCRITARSMVGPAGAAGASGTGSVPHWNPPSHACQAMAVALGSAALPIPGPSATVRHVTRSSAQTRAVRTGGIAPGCLTRSAELDRRHQTVRSGDDAQGGRRLGPVVLRRSRRTEEMTLGHLALERPQGRDLLERLDALRDRAEAQRVGEVHDRAADGVAVAVPTEVGDEGGGDLDRVDRELLQR